MSYQYNDIAVIKVTRNGHVNKYPNIIKVNERPVKRMFFKRNSNETRKLVYDAGEITIRNKRLIHENTSYAINPNIDRVERTIKPHYAFNNYSGLFFEYEVLLSSRLIYKKIDNLNIKSNLDDGRTIGSLVVTERNFRHDRPYHVWDKPMWGINRYGSTFIEPNSVSLNIKRYNGTADKEIIISNVYPIGIRNASGDKQANLTITPTLKQGYSLANNIITENINYSITFTDYIEWRREKINSFIRGENNRRGSGNVVELGDNITYDIYREYKYIDDIKQDEYRNEEEVEVSRDSWEYRIENYTEKDKNYNNEYYSTVRWYIERFYKNNIRTEIVRNKRALELINKNYRTLGEMNYNRINNGSSYTLNNNQQWSNSFNIYRMANDFTSGMSSILGDLNDNDVIVIDKPFNPHIFMTNYLNGTDHQTIWRVSGDTAKNITVIIDAPIHVTLREHDSSEIFFTLIAGGTNSVSTVKVYLTNRASLRVSIEGGPDDIPWADEYNGNIPYIETMSRLDREWRREKAWISSFGNPSIGGINGIIKRI